jgi:long-chain acyl-CoA synthetase
MPRQSVLEYFSADARPANEMAIAWRRGCKIERWSYARLMAAAQWFASELDRREIKRGESVLLWGENSGEWVAAFLGCMARGVLAVPMDAIASADFAGRVAQQVKAKLIVVSRGNPSLDPAFPVLHFDTLADSAGRFLAADWRPIGLHRSDAVQIIFTSGTTAEPRGVVLTHGNLLANLEPIENEFQKYKKYERFVHPLRILNLLPLSHVFGQIMGIFIPHVFGATAHFLDSLRPAGVAATIRSEKINVLVTVPRIAESLREKVERDLESSGRIVSFRRNFQQAEGHHFLRRWWAFRRIHRQFGWQFWAIVSGGAALSTSIEQFWGRMGYAVIQGYGLTETTATVSLNHPFKLTKGSIGKVLTGLEVKLSDEGEILVRGENIASGYWKNGDVAPVLDAEGWFHTGDLGELDANGVLFFKGRNKNVIVTPEGMKVYPEDLEAALRAQPEVRDCVVLGIEREGNAEAYAVLLLRQTNSDAAAIVQRANESLAGYQQIRRWQVWPDTDFPRTPTQKPALAEIRRRIGLTLESRRNISVPPEWIARLRTSSGANVSAQSRLEDDLNLSSMDRVDLLSYLEDRYQIELDEASIGGATTVGDLETLLRQPATHAPAFPYVHWPLRWPTTWIRDAAYYLLVCPAALILGWPRVYGQENLRDFTGPALFVCNHVTTIDLGILLPALPAHVHRHLAVAMGGERLRSMRYPPLERNVFWRIYQQIQYALVAALMNVFPLPQRAGFRESFAFVGELVDRGWSVLIFPEGATTRDGELQPFRTGIGLLASQLNIPVVPMRIDGLFELRQAGKKTARPGQVQITIGVPINFERDSTPEKITQTLEERVRTLRTSAVADQTSKKRPPR